MHVPTTSLIIWMVTAVATSGVIFRPWRIPEYVWALGAAGVDVPLSVNREGDVFDLVIASADRRRFLKAARLH